MPNRNYSAPSYRYGYNGKEKDDEVKGGGAQYDYGFRIYDPRLGKFLSVDPLQRTFPFFSPYHFAGNSPIVAVDLDGLEPKDYKEQLDGLTYEWGSNQKGATVQTIRSQVDGQSWSIMRYPNDDHYYYLSAWDPSTNTPIPNTPRVWGAPDNFSNGQPYIYWQGFTPPSEARARIQAIDDFEKHFLLFMATPALIMTGAEFGLLTIETSLSTGAGSAASDFASQWIWSGGDYTEINYTSVLASGIFSNPFTSSFVGCVTEVNITEEGIDAMLTDKSLPTVAFETAVGTLGNMAGDKILEGVKDDAFWGAWEKVGVSFIANTLGDQPAQGFQTVTEWLYDLKNSSPDSEQQKPQIDEEKKN